MSDITIIAKKAFRFYNPNVKKPDPKSQDDLDAQFKASFQVFARPGDVQTVPGWIKTQPMYKWAVKDGDIVEVEVKSHKEQPIATRPDVTVKKADAEPDKPEDPAPGSEGTQFKTDEQYDDKAKADASAASETDPEKTEDRAPKGGKAKADKG
jgi:hypothetical protein